VAAEALDQHLPELRSFSLLSVLEVHEDVVASLGLLANDISPPGDVVGRVALVAKPEIGVVGRDLHRRRKRR